MNDSERPASEAENATTDKYLRSVTIGDRRPHDDTIHLVPYDQNWPLYFARHADRIRRALSGKVLGLEHVGSTSVPGLSAKPVIDMVLVVADSTDEPSYVPPLESAGFVLRIREPGWFEHRLLKAPDMAGNLHVFSQGCGEIDRMLAFRDRLRTHDADRDLYERAKQEFAARTWSDVDHYAQAKSKVVVEILQRAGAANV
jgi:GrpB-like predicted nucleotidyltransferase (UPF0157 family)